MKKSCLLFVIIAFALPLLIVIVGFFTAGNEALAQYEFVTTYESNYFISKLMWWLALAVAPLAIAPMIWAIKNNKRTIKIISLVVVATLLSTSFAFLSQAKLYSVDNKNFDIIEQTTGFNFSEESTIVCLNSNGKSSPQEEAIVVCEGVIRLAASDLQAVANDIAWQEHIDEAVQQYLSQRFKFQISGTNKYSFNKVDNTAVVVAYYQECDLICFTVLELT